MFIINHFCNISTLANEYCNTFVVMGIVKNRKVMETLILKLNLHFFDMHTKLQFYRAKSRMQTDSLITETTQTIYYRKVRVRVA